MRKILFILFVLCSQILLAQESTTSRYNPEMNYAPNLETATRRAKEEQKLIFVNCYADWALPSQGMEKIVFSDSTFARWLNQYAVPLWIDVVETAEGRDFAKKYGVETFAQYLVLDENATLIHRIVGGQELPRFQHTVARAFNPATRFREQQKAYANGNRKLDFLREYLISLYDGNGDPKEVEALFWEKLPASQRMKKENWRIVSRKASSVDSPVFQEIEKNKDRFVQENGEKAVNDLLAAKFFSEFFAMAGGSANFDPARAQALHSRMSALPKQQLQPIEALYEVARYRHDKNYPEMIRVLREKESLLAGRELEIIDFSFTQIHNLTPRDLSVILPYVRQRASLPDYVNSGEYKNALHLLESVGKGMKFEEGALAQALQKAKSENKQVFLDAYTTWCGPCKIMANKVFTTPQAGDFFNPRFVNIKIDMEKGEGIALAKKYNITSYPTMLLLDTQGDVIHKIVGAQQVKDLIAHAQNGLNDSTSYRGLKKRYTQGDRSPEFLANYYQLMKNLGELPDADKTITQFLSALPLSERLLPGTWALFRDNVSHPENPLITDFLTHIADYKKAIGVQPAERKAAAILLADMQKPYPEKTWKALTETVEKINPEEGRVLILLAKLLTYRRAKAYNAIVALYENEVAASSVDDRVNLDSLLYSFLADAGDTEVYQRAKRYAQTGLTLHKNQHMYEQLIYAFDKQ